MKNFIQILLLSFLFLIGCSPPTLSPLQKYGQHYQQHGDAQSLQRVVDLFELGVDTSDVSKVLGEGIDMGFDYRYLVDSLGENGCVVGAVFHINDLGKIDQKWLGEICE